MEIDRNHNLIILSPEERAAMNIEAATSEFDLENAKAIFLAAEFALKKAELTEPTTLPTHAMRQEAMHQKAKAERYLPGVLAGLAEIVGADLGIEIEDYLKDK